MSKNLNFWRVVATHERGQVRADECDALGMIPFLHRHIAARVFTSKWMAQTVLNEMKRRNIVPEGIKLCILSEEAWELVKDMYYKGKCYGTTLLS